MYLPRITTNEKDVLAFIAPLGKLIVIHQLEKKSAASSKGLLFSLSYPCIYSYHLHLCFPALYACIVLEVITLVGETKIKTLKKKCSS